MTQETTLATLLGCVTEVMHDLETRLQHLELHTHLCGLENKRKPSVDDWLAEVLPKRQDNRTERQQPNRREIRKETQQPKRQDDRTERQQLNRRDDRKETQQPKRQDDRIQIQEDMTRWSTKIDNLYLMQEKELIHKVSDIMYWEDSEGFQMDISVPLQWAIERMVGLVSKIKGRMMQPSPTGNMWEKGNAVRLDTIDARRFAVYPWVTKDKETQKYQLQRQAGTDLVTDITFCLRCGQVHPLDNGEVLQLFLHTEANQQQPWRLTLNMTRLSEKDNKKLEDKNFMVVERMEGT